MYKEKVFEIKQNIFDIIDIFMKLYEDIVDNDLSSYQRELIKVKWIDICQVNGFDE